jgi:hypothetical protein
MPEQAAAARVTNFGEVNCGYQPDAATAEAARCLQCKDAKCIGGCPVNVNIPAFVDAITAFVDAYNDTLTAGHAALDLNQHGLTGSWYEPATSGQGLNRGFANPMSGTGSIFLSWFTYDTVNHGAAAL